MTEKNKAANLGSFHTCQANGSKKTAQNSALNHFTVQTVGNQRSDCESSVQMDIYGNAVPLRDKMIRVQLNKKRFRKGDPGWEEVYLEACRAWNFFKYERHDIYETWFRYCSRKAEAGEDIEPDIAIRHFKMLYDWHFTNSWNPILVRMVLADKSEYGEFLKHGWSKFDSESMPWDNPSMHGRNETPWCCPPEQDGREW